MVGNVQDISVSMPDLLNVQDGKYIGEYLSESWGISQQSSDNQYYYFATR